MTRIEDISFGLGTTEGAILIESEDSPSGHEFSAEDFKIHKEGTDIQARIGVTFGVRFRLHFPNNEKFNFYREVVTHPLMRSPDARLSSIGWDELQFAHNHGWNFTFYTFEYEWEIAAGVWTFEYFTEDGESLASISFNVTR